MRMHGTNAGALRLRELEARCDRSEIGVVGGGIRTEFALWPTLDPCPVLNEDPGSFFFNEGLAP